MIYKHLSWVMQNKSTSYSSASSFYLTVPYRSLKWFYLGKVRTSVSDGDSDGVVRPKSQSPTPKGTAAIHFYSGNPMVEKVKGILHIYKDKWVVYQSKNNIGYQYIVYDCLKIYM